ncbi:MAG: hypothetical protein H6767_04450 [Candidatus Peribacteria bacterium]|nr:MAG: hypothetical protein H6767_04450 [Candidatus Peribacteria bacterium]
MFLIEDRLMISVIHYGYAFLLAVIMVFGSISIPVFRFVYAEVNAGFREDFFAKI